MGDFYLDMMDEGNVLYLVSSDKIVFVKFMNYATN